MYLVFYKIEFCKWNAISVKVKVYKNAVMDHFIAIEPMFVSDMTSSDLKEEEEEEDKKDV